MHKDTYNRRKKQGLCPNCGNVPSDGYVNCDDCRVLNSQKAKGWRNQKISDGLCAQCGKPNSRDTRECVDCSKEKGVRSTARSQQRQAEKTCTKCGESRDGKSKWCAAHRKSRKTSELRWRQSRIANNQCVNCGFHLPEGWVALSCEKCILLGRNKIEDRRRKVIANYGGKCACCGESRFYFLTLDHVNDNGAEERKQPSGQAKAWARLAKADAVSPDYQILCYNCNCAKGHLGSCPHTWDDPDVRPDSAVRKGAVLGIKRSDRRIQQPVSLG